MALTLDNALWRFSCAVYAAGDVGPQCIDLQDRYGIDVNLLLFAAWVGSQGFAMTETTAAEVADVVDAWHTTVVKPLRTARRAAEAHAAEPTIAAHREHLKQVELQAEQIEQAILFRWAEERLPSEPATTTHTAANLRLFLTVSGVPESTAESVVRTLMGAMESA